MKNIIKNIVFGFISWLVPFVAAFFFYTREGQLTIDQFFFKSIMEVIGAICGAVLLYLYFKKVEKHFLQEGIILGLSWYIINVLMDILILLRMSGMSIGTYFIQIGFSYLVILVMAVSAGACLSLRENK